MTVLTFFDYNCKTNFIRFLNNRSIKMLAKRKIKMKNIITIIALTVFTMVSVPTVASAGAKKGQKIFKKKLRKKCGFSGVRFAKHHTQGEWEEIFDDGKFAIEAKKICPRLKLKKIKPSWWEDIYEFSYMYAKDGKIPKC